MKLWNPHPQSCRNRKAFLSIDEPGAWKEAALHQKHPNGISCLSLRELFNIMEYFDLTPTLFLCSYGRSGFPAWDHR